MTEVLRPVSTKPIWIGASLGLLAGFFLPFFGVVITVPVGALLGYAIVTREHAQRQHRELSARLGDLLERVSLLEYSVKQLRLADSSAVAAPDEPLATRTGYLPPIATAPVVPAASPQAPAALERVASGSAQSVQAPPKARIAPLSGTPTHAQPAPTPTPTPSAAAVFLQRAIAAAKGWLLGGNTVARVGLLVLFVGVAFLLRYVAERTQISIELRLVAVALGALALLVLGWRLRNSRPGYAISLQGGAIGILYLTVFAAMRLYDLLPALPAFALLASLAVFSGVLAVAQNARALAALGATGGFLAPILVSTGSGRVEILFSYYLLLNLGVLGIAWFRAWRELNWIGFVFTFAVMGTWVAQRYTADQYLLAQGFLIAFWLLFLAVSLLYALRQPKSMRGIFDTTLMFALPLAAFGIQSRLTSGVQLALASAVAAAAYLASSSVLLRKREASLRVLTEASFGVGVAFLTLAVPLAASAQWTAAAWALEGLALLWVGVRQQRALPLAAGLVLHVAAALALVRAVSTGVITTLPEFSGFTLNLVVFAATAFAASILLARAVAMRSAFGTLGAAALANDVPWAMRLVTWGWVALLVWQPLPYPLYVYAWCSLSLALMVLNQRGALQLASARDVLTPEWVAAAVIALVAWLATEVRAGQLLATDQTTLLRLSVTVTAIASALLSLSGAKSQRTAAAGLLTLGVFVWLLALFAEAWNRIDEPLAVAQIGLLLVAFTAAALTMLAQRVQWVWPLQLSWLYFLAHLALAAWVVVGAASESELPGEYFGWIVWPLAWAFFYARLYWDARAPLMMSASLQSVLHVGGLWLLTAMIAAEAALRLDLIAGSAWYHALWGAVPAVALWLVVGYALRWPMRAAPVAYAQVGAPGLAIFLLVWIVVTGLFIPGEVSPVPYVPLLNPLDIAALLALAALVRWHLTDQRVSWHRAVGMSIGVVAFIALNVAALRAVHFLADVPWTPEALTHSRIVQAVLSLLWTVTAMGLMVFAHRRGMRGWWLLGAGLLTVVVVKLFFVDLSGQETIERIVSFVGVGLLILLIGYLAPVPPSAVKTPTGSA